LFYYPSTFPFHLIKLVVSPDHICFVTRAPFMTIWSNLFHHLITFDLSPEHLPIPLNQTINKWHQVMKQVWSRGNGKWLGDINKCDQMIKQVWSRGNGRCLGDLNKCDQVIKQVWSRGIGRCSGDKTNVIKWWNKFDQVERKGARVIKQMLSGDKTSLIKWSGKVLGWQNKCDQVITQVCSRGNERCSGDKTNAIRWWNKFDQERMEGARVIK
jgi:hypothetical protein